MAGLALVALTLCLSVGAVGGVRVSSRTGLVRARGEVRMLGLRWRRRVEWDLRHGARAGSGRRPAPGGGAASRGGDGGQSGAGGPALAALLQLWGSAAQRRALRRATRAALRVQRARLSARIGLTDALETALACGAARALLGMLAGVAGDWVTLAPDSLSARVRPGWSRGGQLLAGRVRVRFRVWAMLRLAWRLRPVLRAAAAGAGAGSRGGAAGPGPRGRRNRHGGVEAATTGLRPETGGL